MFETHRFQRILARADAASREVFEEGQDALAGVEWTGRSDRAQSAEDIAAFILASLTPDSGLRRIFEKGRIADPRFDRVLLALDATRRVLDEPGTARGSKRKPWSWLEKLRSAAAASVLGLLGSSGRS